MINSTLVCLRFLPLLYARAKPTTMIRYAASLIAFFGTGLLQAQVTLTTSPYVENFNGIAAGLPGGFSVQTGSVPTAAGTNASYTATATSWNNTTAGFYNCASATGLTNTSNPNQQALSTNRALCVRQTASYGNPGAAFVFKIANTTNLSNFRLSFRLVSLDSTAEAITSWAVDYGFGANPTSFTGVTPSPANVRTGGKPGPTNTYKFFTDVAVNFGSALDNKSDVVWIRVWTPFATTATTPALLGFNGTPTMSGIDDWSLSFDGTPPPPPPPTSVTSIEGDESIVKFLGSLTTGVQLQFNEAVTTPTSLQIISTDGRIVWNKQLGQVIAGQTEFIQPEGLNSGIYILTIRQKGRVYTRKLVK